MTVEELIDRLKECPSNYYVTIKAADVTLHISGAAIDTDLHEVELHSTTD